MVEKQDINRISAELTRSAVNLTQGIEEERGMETVYLVCGQIAALEWRPFGGHPLLFCIQAIQLWQAELYQNEY